MDNVQKDTALLAIEECRAVLLEIVNGKMDALRQRILDGEGAQPCAGSVYPLDIPPALFKGTKPAAVFFGEERVAADTWKKVYTEILAHCAADPENLAALMVLRNRVAGRTRTILSDTHDGMARPVMLAKGLYAEAFFDTEWLIRVLTGHILDAIHYDYSGVFIEVHTNA